MSSGLQEKIASHLPGGMPAQAGGHMDAGAVLDPSALAKLPPAVADAVRWGLADKLTDAFALGLPILAVVFVATLFIPNTPLRESNDDHPVEDAGQQVLDAYASESGEGDHRTPGEGSDSVSGSAASDLTGARRG